MLKSIDSVISGVVEEIIYECSEMFSSEAIDIGHWLMRAEGEDNPSRHEVQKVQFELIVFNVAMLLHLISHLSPMTDELHERFLDKFLSYFNQWTYTNFYIYLSSARTNPQLHLRRRSAEYDRLTVITAIVDIEPTAQANLCGKLFRNTNVPSDVSDQEKKSFRMLVFSELVIHHFSKICDSIYKRLGPNSRFHSYYRADAIGRHATIESLPHINLRTLPEKLAEPAALYLRPRRTLYLVSYILFTLLEIGSVTCMSISVLGIITAFPNIPQLATFVLLLPMSLWLLIWARRHLVANVGALQVLRSGRYILYLRESDVDKFPPYLAFEAKLVSAFRNIAPLLSIDFAKVLHPSGAVRISVGDDWQIPLTELMRQAVLCIFIVGPRRGYDQGWGRIDEAWKEIESITKLSRPGRALFMFPRQTGDFPLLLLHPKGDRAYGVSTLLHEVRRFVDERPYTKVPVRMGGDEWLWWGTDGHFIRLPSKASRFAVFVTKRIKSELSPVYQAFEANLKADWMTNLRFVLGALIGIYVIFREGSVIDILSSNIATLMASGVACLFIIWEIITIFRNRSQWQSYINTIRPRGIHSYGLEDVHPGKTHPDLPH